MRDRHRRPGSGSTPHDRRRAPCRATPIAFASNRAPERDSAGLTTSKDPLQASCTCRSGACSRPNSPAFILPADKTARRWPPRRRPRSVRDPQIPIDRPTQTAPFLPAVSSLGGFRTPAPRSRTTARNGPASETLHHLCRSRRQSRTAATSAPAIRRPQTRHHAANRSALISSRTRRKSCSGAKHMVRSVFRKGRGLVHAASVKVRCHRAGAGK